VYKKDIVPRILLFQVYGITSYYIWLCKFWGVAALLFSGYKMLLDRNLFLPHTEYHAFGRYIFLSSVGSRPTWRFLRV
jgi:hypothetical protein